MHRLRHFALLGLLSCPTAFSALAEEKVSVTSGAGVFTGEKVRGSLLYPNIAYGKPPVGKLRWRRSFLENKARQLKSGVQCPQFYNDYLPGTPLPNSEDCLYLNVWAPVSPSADGKKHPVIFFMHGGGLLTGTGLKDFYDGSVFARENVVFVAINYRLGELGYGPSLEKSRGSLGLSDQGLALEWVVRNIEAFGGDPSNIYLMGHSKGAEAVTGLVQSGLTGDGVKGGITLSSPRHFEVGTQMERKDFWPGQQTEGWESILKKRASILYVPDLPSFRIPHEAGNFKFRLLASTVYDESPGVADIEVFCGILHTLEQFPAYVDAYYYIWHSPFLEHGGELVNLFKQDAYGKVVLRHLLSFVRNGEPQAPSVGFRLRPWNEKRALMHVYPFMSFTIGYEIPEVAPGELNKFEAIRSVCKNKALPGSKINRSLYMVEKALRWWRGPQPDMFGTKQELGVPRAAPPAGPASSKGSPR